MLDSSLIIRHAQIRTPMTVNELVNELGGCAFGAGRIAEAVDIMEMMMLSDTTKFLGLAGALVPAGMRRILSDMVYDGYVDVLVTTGANIVHDIIESLGGHHYHGTAAVNDIELRDKQINRIFDVFLPEEHFTTFEEHMLNAFAGLEGRTLSIRELITALGENIDCKNSILGACYEMEVPIYCPGIADSAIGLQAWLHKQTLSLNVDVFEDMKEFMDICYEARSLGAFILGGGLPKNYILQSMIAIPRGGMDYSIQITMDRPETGGLSGATLDEAKSWGKVKGSGSYVTVYADITIALPIIIAATRERLECKK